MQIENVLSELAIELSRIEKTEAAIQNYIAKRYPELGQWKAKARELQQQAEAIVPSVPMPEGKKSTAICGFKVGMQKQPDKWELTRPEDDVIAALRENNCLPYIREKFELDKAQLRVNPLPIETAEKCGLTFVKGVDKPKITKLKVT